MNGACAVCGSTATATRGRTTPIPVCVAHVAVCAAHLADPCDVCDVDDDGVDFTRWVPRMQDGRRW